MRKNTKKVDIIIIAVIFLLIVGGILLAILSNSERENGNVIIADTNGDGEITYTDYIGKRVGIVTGSSFEAPTFEYLPDSEYLYYDTLSDIILALEQNKIDCFIYDEPVLRMAHLEKPEVGYLDDVLREDCYSFAFPKNNEKADHTLEQFNEMLSGFTSDGTLEKMKTKWFSENPEKNRVDFSGLTGENGTLKIVTVSTNVPFSMVAEGELTGYSIELVTEFCRRYGYDCIIDQTNVSSSLAGISTGIYDMLASCSTVTKERKESMNFSDPIYVGGISLAVRNSDLTQTDDSVTEDTPLSYFGNKRIGILTGSSYEPAAQKTFPNAEYVYFDVASDLALAIATGKIDGYLMSIDQAETMIAGNPTLFWLRETVEETPYAFAFPKTEKGAALRDKVNEFIAKIKADGTMDALLEKWTKGNIEQAVDFTGFTGENGILDIACAGTTPPWDFTYNGKNTGYEIELVAMFCREYGYTPEFDTMTFSAVIPGIASGKYDMAAANLTVTPERAESVYFSDQQSGSTVVFVTAAGNTEKTKNSGKASLSDFNGKRAGVITGSMHDALISKKLPDSQRFEYKNYSDLTEALVANKIDYFLMSRDGINDLMAENDKVDYVDEPLDTLDVGAIFAKSAEGSKIRSQFDEFITKIKSDGTLESIYEYWRSSEADGKSVDMSGLTGENGTLVFATTGDKPPVTYVASGIIAGTDPDIAVRFCREYGYNINVEIVDGGGLIPGVISGIYDFSMADLVITDERKESVDFSVPYTKIELFVTARKEDIADTVIKNDDTNAENGTNFLDSIATSFEKNFIREERWKLILEGIGTTCLITGLSTLFGTLLAFLICMFRRTGSRLADGISNVYVKLLQGTPMVVLLMILYYVLLGKSGLEAVWVAVVGFTLNFGAYASEIMRSGIESIDGGQREAALALGYNENQAFFRFIFPQAAARFIPVYKQEIISLLKSTSIVGYIAIQDLTKMSDIIRSRTYEAFFPLIATAIIYFILAWIISLLLKIILTAVDNRRSIK